MGKLAKTKTFWVAILALGAAVVAAFFPGADNQPASISSAFHSLMNDPKLWLGLLGITGRSAALKMQSPEP